MNRYVFMIVMMSFVVNASDSGCESLAQMSSDERGLFLHEKVGFLVVEDVEKVIEYGVYIDYPNKDGQSPLLCAVQDYFLLAECVPWYSMATSFMGCRFVRCENIINLLLKNNAKPDSGVYCRDGMTPLGYAKFIQDGTRNRNIHRCATDLIVKLNKAKENQLNSTMFIMLGMKKV